MKLAIYTKNGRTCFGAVTPSGLVTLNDRLGPDIDSLGALLAHGDLAHAALVAAAPPVDATLAEVTLLPLLVPGAKILCAGLNYQSHADEIGRDKPKPNVRFFLRVPSSLVAHGVPVRLPNVSRHFDYEGELCVVIGKGGRHIAAEAAMSHVAGYTALMDGSVRDYQKNSVTAGKNFDASGSVGPWMVTADEIPDVTKVELVTRINGEQMQRSDLSRLIHGIPRMIAYMSGIMRLEPGDLIATGTPDGSGQHRTPQSWLQAGDRIEVELSGIGILENTVAVEDAA
jgi:2-keto-4-pentenoate hydratase/2-oxohepta-3-ene-1,7-dioic acid hydratase in catechol pathway